MENKKGKTRKLELVKIEISKLRNLSTIKGGGPGGGEEDYATKTPGKDSDSGGLWTEENGVKGR